MAEVKDIIVNGTTHLIGEVTGEKNYTINGSNSFFVGNLQGVAEKAKQDALGNTIDSTYIKEIKVSDSGNLSIIHGNETSASTEIEVNEIFKKLLLTSDSETDNTDTFLNLTDTEQVISKVQLVGTGTTTVSSKDGVFTINSKEYTPTGKFIPSGGKANQILTWLSDGTAQWETISFSGGSVSSVSLVLGESDSVTNSTTSNDNTFLNLVQNGQVEDSLQIKGSGGAQVKSDGGIITIETVKQSIAVGNSEAITNSATSNENTFINFVQDGKVEASVQLIGSGSTTVTSDSGIITIATEQQKISDVTNTKSGLMTSEYKIKLDGIEANANKVTKEIVSGWGFITETGADTKNTAGATSTNDKIFLIGALENTANPQTYTKPGSYIDENNKLYIDSDPIATEEFVEEFEFSNLIFDYGEKGVVFGANDIFDEDEAEELKQTNPNYLLGALVNTKSDFSGSSTTYTFIDSAGEFLPDFVKKTGGTITGDLTVEKSLTVKGIVNCADIVNAVVFNTTSDIRLKENIEEIDDCLEKVSFLSPYTFNFINDETKKRHAGLIAQEIEQVLPEAISETDGIKHVNYDSVIALLVGAIKDLKQEIEVLKNSKS